MTIERLIELIGKCNQQSEVFAYDADSQQIEPVTGILYDEKTLTFIVCTDDMMG